MTKATAEAEGASYVAHPGNDVVARMLEAGRPGRLRGQGFYDYPEGQPKRLWSGLKDLYPQQRRGEYDVQELRDRFLYAQAVDAAHVADQGVLTEARELNIGSIMGLGFPVWTGGAWQFIEQTGREQFVARARELAAKHGPRFEPPARLSAAPEADLSGGMYSGLPK